MRLGKTVSRSTYQKVVEENKKLLKDLKFLSMPHDQYCVVVEQIKVIQKWREHFKKDDRAKNWVLRFLLDEVCECEKPKHNYPEMVWCNECGNIINH